MLYTIQNNTIALDDPNDNDLMLMEYKLLLSLLDIIPEGKFKEQELRKQLNIILPLPIYFIYNFTDRIFWVKQIVNSVIQDRIIFVELNNYV